jgi:hypothetical protein
VTVTVPVTVTFPEHSKGTVVVVLVVVVLVVVVLVVVVLVVVVLVVVGTVVFVTDLPASTTFR